MQSADIKLTRKKKYKLLNNLKRKQLQDMVNEILNLVDNIIDTQKIIIKKIEYIKRKHPNELKAIKKEAQTKVDNIIKSGLRYKVSFSKSVKLSNKLTDFLKIDNDTTMSVSEIVNNITKYIRTNKLQDPNNRKAFNPDENLQGLFEFGTDIKNTSSYTYYGIQKYIKPHLIYS